MIKRLKTALGERLLLLALDLLEVPEGTRWNIAQVINQKRGNGQPKVSGMPIVTEIMPETDKWWNQ